MTVAMANATISRHTHSPHPPYDHVMIYISARTDVLPAGLRISAGHDDDVAVVDDFDGADFAGHAELTERAD